MWAEAAKRIATFQEGVITAFDAAGYPLSVRQTALPYDAQTGAMRVAIPDALGAVEGPANLLCHFHDDKLWNMRTIQVEGRLERSDGAWRFVTTRFAPQSALSMIRGMHRSMNGYLERRGLSAPSVDWTVIARLWEQAKRIEHP